MEKLKKTYELDEQTVGIIEDIAKLFEKSEESIIETAICQPQLLIAMEYFYLKNKDD